MERRNFLKAAAISGATAALGGCGHPEEHLIRFIPEEDLVPGIATWKPGICPLCPAGCGLIVRVMEGDAEVVRHGQLGLMQMGLAKKLEGNPEHPVNRGKLCPRGQAGLQVTYHPDRVKTPLKLSGSRGSGNYVAVSWEEGIKTLVTQLGALNSTQDRASLVFLTRRLRGQRREVIEQFLVAFGAPPPVTFEAFDESVVRWANFMSFGSAQLATFDLAHSNYVVSFGADFLGTWNSPVAQAIGYGEMRQGRPGARTKFVQVEPRISQTGANADEWFAAKPGSEGVLALGLAHVILNEKLVSAPSKSRATDLIEGWSEGLPDYAPAEVEKRTGIGANTVTRLARELAAHQPALAMIGGAALAHTNGAFNALAVNALNQLLGNVGKEGGILFTPQPSSAISGSPAAATTPAASLASILSLSSQIRIGSQPPKILMVYDANPVFATPPDLALSETLGKIPFIVSFGSFIDETSSLADLILPDHSYLESWSDDVPEAGTELSVLSLAPPAMHPLHDTRSMPDVLLDVAHQLGGNMASSLPAKSYEEMLRAAFDSVNKSQGLNGSSAAVSSDDFWSKVQAQGGWWSVAPTKAPPRPPEVHPQTFKFTEPEFDGSASDYPFHFQPFVSPLLYDGSLAHLPWMQEAPDPLSTAMWGAWVEINPSTAGNLKIQQGDLVEIASAHGRIQAPAVLSPGIAPDVVAMPAGQGHETYTRYASGRGANPFAILAPKTERETGSLAWAATRVKISRIGTGKLVLFGGGVSRFPTNEER